ncbi:acyl-CoA dehydrogenase family protein [Rhizobium sp.]
MNVSTSAARIDCAEPLIAPSFDAVAIIFRPIFRRIAACAIVREQQRQLPFEPVRWLKEQRFGALRVPVQFGGYGLDHRGYLQLLIELAEADPNVAHLFRGHFAVVEEKLGEPDLRRRSIWLERIGRGDIVGNASTEPGESAVDKKSTRLLEIDGGWHLSGTKFYTTGSIFADWIDVSARRSDDEHVSVLVDRKHPGVAISDDWDGFGQRLTGTGTGVFDEVPVEDHAVLLRSERLPYLGAVYQTVLLATLAGIARSIAHETAAHLKIRKRIYSHGNSDLAKDDPQLKQVVGEIAATAHAAESLVLSTSTRFAEAQAAVLTRNPDLARAAAQAVEIEVNKVQIVVAELVLRAASRLFDALGASAVRLENGLDRHWRNARTILSHNPLVYRARIVGDFHVNDKQPDLAWSVGIAGAGTDAGREDRS